MYSYRSSTDTKKARPSCDCPTSSSAEKKNVVDAPYVPTRSARLPSQESMTKAPEPALSNFRSDSRLLTRCAGDVLCRERKGEGAGGGARAQGRGKAVPPGATRECAGTPEAPLHQDLNASLSLRAAPTSARISPLLHASAHHLHLQVSGPYIAVGLVGFWTSAKSGYHGDAHGKVYAMTAQPGHTRELERWFNRPKAANSAPRVCTRFSSRRTVRRTLGWFELKKDPAFSISKSAAQRRSIGAHPRHDRRLPEWEDEPATGLTRATRLAEAEGGEQAVRVNERRKESGFTTKQVKKDDIQIDPLFRKRVYD
ncbi:hypothetical protein EDB86DRAFT_3247565 [Lactarius hatsudake]|nr:hypothetical protein EDB86DRAFT_3247565 [Lactarius hatsudake]